MLEQTPREQRQQLIDENHRELSLRRQCQLLGVNRSTVYYKPREANAESVELLNEIRDIWERYPFYGYRRITKELQFKGHTVNFKRVRRLMKLGGIRPIYPGPNTSRRNKLHAIHPYLLGDVEVTRPNQAWMVDLTYLRLNGGFMYLVAFIDIHSRYIVSWALSNTLETACCVEALQKGLEVAAPDLINSDQGCQFTSEEWVLLLNELGIKISMTGKGRCLDNVYIERFWRSFKQEKFYLHEYNTVKALRLAIAEYVEFYNQRRWHQSLDYKTPADVYFGQERKACGYMDESFSPASTLWGVCTN